MRTPFGACREKNASCSFENSRLSGVDPLAASSTSSLLQLPLKDAEHTNPPGAASSSTLKLSERSSFGSMVAGSTGLSLTTVSARPPWKRRARTIRPARFSLRSGVSKKNACLGCDSTGSSPMPLVATLLSLSGTVSFNSTLPACFSILSTRWTSSGERLGAGRGAARFPTTTLDLAFAVALATVFVSAPFFDLAFAMIFSCFQSLARLRLEWLNPRTAPPAHRAADPGR